MRRGLLPLWAKTRWGKMVLATGIVVFLGTGTTLVLATRSFLDHDSRFRIDSAASIQTMGNSQLSRYDLLSVFGSDIGRNLFFVPLGERRAELERFPWVERATVMRLMPNQLRVAVTERTPIAFVEVRGRIELADAAGVILDMTPQEMAAKHYSFPVVTGINPADPLSMRGARMQIYQRFVSDLDSGGQHISARLSEVNLSDPEDVRATVPANGSDIELQFGQQDFLARWNNYAAHIAQWRQQYPKLAAVDLRYDHEVVLKMAQDVAASANAGAGVSSAAPSAVHSNVQRTKTGKTNTAKTRASRRETAKSSAKSAAKRAGRTSERGAR